MSAEKFIPEAARPVCPACGTIPQKLANDDLRVWWCASDSCRVHQYQDELD